MKTLKFIGITLGTLLFLIFIIALFVPKEFSFKKSILINAPVDSVWKQVNSLSAMDKWSPWNDRDPELKKEYTGVDGIVGAKQSWDGDVIGTGSQTITKIVKPVFVETSLDFLKPHESHGIAFVKLVAEGKETKVTWGMTENLVYPFNFMILFMNIEKGRGKDWNNGLLKLKMLCEK